MIPWAVVLYVRERDRSNRFWSKEVLFFVAMAGWFLLSTLWSSSHSYKIQKALCFSFYTIPAFLMGYLVISNNCERLVRLLQSLLIFALIVFAETFRVFYVKGMGSIQDIMGTNYLVTGQTLGVGLIVLIVYSLHRFVDANRKTLGLEIVLGSLFFYGLINIGGRGPFAACAISTLVLYAVFCRYSNAVKNPLLHLVLFSTVTFVLCVGLNYLFHQQGSHFANRMMPLLNSIKADGSAMERLEFYQSAIKAFVANPVVGLGFGGWPVYHGLSDISYHPHNIFLEIMAETGMVGLLLFVAFLTVCVQGLSLGPILSSPLLVAACLITLFAFMNACKTGDLHDNMLFFFALSLVAGLKRNSISIKVV
ncbi:O-antigen ligase family protein [Candidatus Finniella inopinata]|uniref:O-antigen ligase family protein n=1 Tax=Candidatus Finniella inopinata TaxID=1696036 RepID=UPI0013EE5D84|nr:O-antigen ligase family protein [Candidatus Finniella inopinata]